MAKNSNAFYSVWVYYKSDDLVPAIERLAKPGLCFGGGTDLRTGERDVSYEFKTVHSAECARARIKNALGRKVRAKVVVD